MKILDKAALEMSEAMIDYQMYAESDGIITPDEERILSKLRGAYAYVEEAVARKRLAQRIEGGGEIDRKLRGQIRDVITLK